LNSFSAIFIGSDSLKFSTKIGADLLIYKARVPMILAFSYLVKKGEVILSAFGLDLF